MKYQQLQSKIREPLFSLQDLRLNKINIYPYQLNLWKKKGYLESVKNGVYIFVDRRDNIECNELAFSMYQPSYISLESALSYHGLIPEIVLSITSITTKTNRKYQNGFGKYIYRHIHPKYFWGYRTIPTKQGKYLIAEPEKALLDFVYLNLGDLDNENDVSEMRINPLIYRQIISQRKLKIYLSNYSIKKMKLIIKIINRLCLRTNK